MKRFSFAVAALVALLAVPAAHAQFKGLTGTQTFNVADKGGRNQAIFHSKAPLEDITGTSSGVGGTVTFDVANVAKTIKADITVDVASIKTGIDLRDEHLRSEGWLNAEKHPKLMFALKSVKGAKMKSDNTMEMTAVGTMTINGITQPSELQVSLRLMPESDATKKRAPGDLLVVRAKGKVQLTKFGVNQPAVVGSKMNDMVDIEFNAVASNK
jgi:polyisoprenoid-binding protein YceI